MGTPTPAARFQVTGLDPSTLDLSEAVRLFVDSHPGYPCRVSLEDAAVGETVLAFHYLHHDTESPYRASGPIFVRVGAVRADLAPGVVPAMLLHRQLSVRAYDAEGMMVAAAILPGTELAEHAAQRFEDTGIAYLQVHNAGPGCFNCAVERVS